MMKRANVNVYWLEQTEADVPPGQGWLSPAEAVRLQAMRFAKRRADWRLGRWTAKCALAAYLNLNNNLQRLCAVELRAAPDGAPEAYVDGQPAPVSLSLSHRDGTAACALALPGAALGCDLETVEPHSDSFVADYFTVEEQALLAQSSAGERFRVVALLWSAKECALKALRTGLRLDTRCVIASPADALHVQAGEWRPLHVSCVTGRGFHGWWQQTGNRVRTLVAAPSPAAPLALLLAAASSPAATPRPGFL